MGMVSSATLRSKPAAMPTDLELLNELWIYWVHQLSSEIHNIAHGDDDLKQEAFLALREQLEQDPDTPRHFMLRAAQMRIYRAYSQGSSVDSRKSAFWNDRSRKGGVELLFLDQFEDADYYLPVTERAYAPDTLAIDRVAYQNFREDLEPDEQRLLDVMREGAAKNKFNSFRQSYVMETGMTVWHYGVLRKRLGAKFDFHYNT